MNDPADSGRLEINGVSYLSTNAAAERAGISRQTLWRWRQIGKIPSGHRFRGRHVIFTEDEARAIQEFANRVEPIDATVYQMKLFNGEKIEEKP